MREKIEKLVKSNLIKAITLILVLLFTFVLRAHNFDRVPSMGHLEELMFAWAGIHLIERGVPQAWTSLDFPKRALVYQGRVDYKGGDPAVYVDLVQPWLEHPPLFSLLVGGSAHLYGANRDEVIPTSFIRMPMIFLALATSIFIFLIVKLISGFWTGILAVLIYGTTPILVVGSRMAVPENVIACLYLIAIYLLIKFQIKPSFKWIVFIPLLAGLGGLSKAPGFFIIFFAIYTVISKKWYKSALYLFLATIPFVVLFFLYGLHFDPEIFWKINAIQSFRPVGFASLSWFFVSPAYDISQLLDSWFVFLLLAAAFFLFVPQEGYKKFIAFAFVFWVIIVMISGGETDLLPWYRFPSYPLLAILGTWGIQHLYKRADFFASFLMVGLLLGNRHLLVNAFRPNITPMNYRIVLSLLLAPSLLRSLMDTRWMKNFCQIVLIGVVVIGIYFNTIYIYNQFELTCENISCPFGSSTGLSSLYFPIIWRWFVLGEPTYY